MFKRILSTFKNTRLRNEFLKSIAVGVFSSALDFLITAVILYIEGAKHYDGFLGVITGATINGIPHVVPMSVYIFATALGFSVAFIVNYILSVFFVYVYGNVGKNKSGLVRFGLFALASAIITIVGSLLLRDVLMLNLWIVKILMVLVVFVFNAFTRKRYVFNIKRIIDEDNTIAL